MSRQNNMSGHSGGVEELSEWPGKGCLGLVLGFTHVPPDKSHKLSPTHPIQEGLRAWLNALFSVSCNF